MSGELEASVVQESELSPSSLPLEESMEDEDEEYYDPVTGMGEVPELPERGETIEAFIPESWTLMDGVELDFDGDGIPDYVGVVERRWTDAPRYPRILFILQGDGEGYRLDLADTNAVQYYFMSMNPDPYEPLTAEDGTFTIHIDHLKTINCRDEYDFTFEWRDGDWYFLREFARLSHFTNEFHLVETWDDDYSLGIGIRTEGTRDEIESSYEVALDEAPTLHSFFNSKYSQWDFYVTMEE